MQLTKLEIKRLPNVQTTSLETLKLLMSFFGGEVSSKENYDTHELDIFREKYDISDVTHPLTSIEVERMLSRIKLSASGCDDIPAWLLRRCSYELADIVAHIVNCSVISGTVPSYWLNALVTPVPKVPKLTGFSDFRPISVGGDVVGISPIFWASKLESRAVVWRC